MDDCRGGGGGWAAAAVWLPRTGAAASRQHTWLGAIVAAVSVVAATIDPVEPITASEVLFMIYFLFIFL